MHAGVLFTLPAAVYASLHQQKLNTAEKKPLSTMLAASKNVLLPVHNHLLTAGTDNTTLWLSPKRQRVKGHQYRWLAGGYDLEIWIFRSG